MLLKTEFQNLVDTLKARQTYFDSWQDLMKCRVEANEELLDETNSKLSYYEEKISMKKLFESNGVPTSKVVYNATKGFVSQQKIAKYLSESQSKLVAKASHLTTGDGIFFIAPNGGEITYPTPVGPGKNVMAQRQQGSHLTINLVVESLIKALDRNAGEREAKALRECQRGVIVEEYFPHDMELRVVCIFGNVVVAANDNQDRIDRRGKLTSLRGRPTISTDWIQHHWPRIVKWTEKLAKGTDYLRVDYFIQVNSGKIAASEMNTFPWPESTFFDGFETILLSKYLESW